MTPDQAKQVADLRMKILQGLKEGKPLREITTREEVRKAVEISREARRTAPVVQDTAKKGAKKAAVQVDLDDLLGE